MTKADAIYESLATSLASLNHSLVMQGAREAVPEYKGNPKTFKKWIKSIEKYSYCIGANDKTTKLVAYQSSQGVVSDFIGRFLKEENPGSWEELKDEIKVRFADIPDPRTARSILNRRFKQGKHESIKHYAERLYDLAEEAYSEEDRRTDFVQFTLMHSFIDGLADADIVYTIMEAEPVTLDAAIKLALNEKRNQKIVY